jgi:hypothetical protein
MDFAIGQTEKLTRRFGASLIIEGQLGEPALPIG